MSVKEVVAQGVLDPPEPANPPRAAASPVSKRTLGTSGATSASLNPSSIACSRFGSGLKSQTRLARPSDAAMRSLFPTSQFPRLSAPRSSSLVPDLTSRGQIKLNPRIRLRRCHVTLASSHRILPLIRVPSGEAVAPIYSARRPRLFAELSREFHLKRQLDRETLDLIEMRRQLTALRSQHSDNLSIASLLNRFLVKVAFLSEPGNLAREQHLRAEFVKTLKKVEAIASRKPGTNRSSVKKPSK